MLLQWAQFADGFAVVIGWSIGIYVDDDPWMERGNPSGWFWYFFAVEYCGDKPKRRSCFLQMHLLCFTQ